MLFHSRDNESVSLVDSDKEAKVEDGIRVDGVDAVTDHFDPFEGPVWDDQYETLIIIWLSCIGMGNCTQTKVLGTL